MTALIAFVAAVLFAAALAAFAWWLFEGSEGAYLGPWAVKLGYDRFAARYDRRKAFDLQADVEDLALPFFARIEAEFGSDLRVLDVATGTGRMPIAMFSLPWFRGRIVCLDISQPMLDEAARKLAAIGKADRAELMLQAAEPLPFDDASFDGVSMIEALEFLPDRSAALSEIARVVRPGGWLLLTNRIGGGAWMMPGRTEPTEALMARLGDEGWQDVHGAIWTNLYDRVWARRPCHD